MTSWECSHDFSWKFKFDRKLRRVATVGGARETMSPLLQFPNQARSRIFSFKHQRYWFLRMFRNYTDQKFHKFYRVCYNFWTIYGGNFSNYIREQITSRSTFLKGPILNAGLFFLWTIQKKTIMNESLNLRSQAKFWTYRKTLQLNM